MLVHADPAGDVGALALALDAEFVIVGPGGERTVAAGDFFRDLFETAVGEGELLARIRVPKHTGWGAHYEKFVRVAHQWSIVAVGATVRVDGGAIAEARIGLDEHGGHAAARHGSGAGTRRPAGERTRRSGRPAPRPPRARTRRQTSTAAPTTAGTSRRC